MLASAMGPNILCDGYSTWALGSKLVIMPAHGLGAEKRKLWEISPKGATFVRIGALRFAGLNLLNIAAV